MEHAFFSKIIFYYKLLISWKTFFSQTQNSPSLILQKGGLSVAPDHAVVQLSRIFWVTEKKLVQDLSNLKYLSFLTLRLTLRNVRLHLFCSLASIFWKQFFLKRKIERASVSDAQNAKLKWHYKKFWRFRFFYLFSKHCACGMWIVVFFKVIFL